MNASAARMVAGASCFLLGISSSIAGILLIGGELDLSVDTIFDLIFVLWFALPSIAVVLAVADRLGGTPTITLAMGIAVAGQLAIPSLVQKSIEDDPSSTAVIIHIYDPLLTLIPVGIVLGIAALRARREGRRAT